MAQPASRPTSHVEFRSGRPVIVFDGEPLSQAMYCDPKICRPGMAHSAPQKWLQRNREFFDCGVHNFHVIPVSGPDSQEPGRFWTGDGEYPDCSPDDDFYCIDRQATDLVAMDPGCRIIVRLGDRVPRRWYEANPDHVAVSSTGEEARHRRPSIASQKAVEGLCTKYRRVVEYVEAQPWADRVYAYWMYPHGEGTTMLNNAGFLFDCSPVMQHAFRRWVREHYTDVAALREAWGDPAVTFDSVRVPTDDEWRRARELARRGGCHVWCEEETSCWPARRSPPCTP